MIENPVTGQKTSKLCLNEVFAAEKDVSCTSMYRLFVDGRDMGKFKSSGIIIATGTGSSGWLFSCRQITTSEVEMIKSIVSETSHYPNPQQQNQLDSNTISGLISSSNVFPYD